MDSNYSNTPWNESDDFFKHFVFEEAQVQQGVKESWETFRDDPALVDHHLPFWLEEPLEQFYPAQRMYEFDTASQASFDSLSSASIFSAGSASTNTTNWSFSPTLLSSTSNSQCGSSAYDFLNNTNAMPLPAGLPSKINGSVPAIDPPAQMHQNAVTSSTRRSKAKTRSSVHDRTYKCDWKDCKHPPFKQKGSLQQHILLTHKQITPFISTVCDCDAGKCRTMWKHISQIHGYSTQQEQRYIVNLHMRWFKEVLPEGEKAKRFRFDLYPLPPSVELAILTHATRTGRRTRCPS